MENTPPPVETKFAETTDDKTVAIVSYLTIIGFIIALVMHGNKKTRLGAFHLRQSLGLMLTAVVASVTVPLFAWVPIIGWLAALIVWIGLLVLWVMGLVAAINGQLKPLPWVGEHFNKWFANTFE